MAGMAETINKILKENQDEKLKCQRKEWEENQLKLITHIYKENRAYSNIVMLAGYAGYFSLWFTLKSALSPLLDLIVAMLLVVSLASFVFFEIYKVYLFTVKLEDPTDYLEGAKTYEELNKAVGQYKKAFDELEFAQRGKWAFSFFLSLTTGLSGVGVLLFFLVKSLIEQLN